MIAYYLPKGASCVFRVDEPSWRDALLMDDGEYLTVTNEGPAGIRIEYEGGILRTFTDPPFDRKRA